MLRIIVIFAGHYAYIEASLPNRPHTKATLQSPGYPATTGKCMSFYYHMHGADMGTLNIYMLRGRFRYRLWTRSGEQGSKWVKGIVSLRSSAPFSIDFEGIIGKGFRSDIAIDDIKVNNGLCQTAGTKQNWFSDFICNNSHFFKSVFGFDIKFFSTLLGM